MYGFVTIILLPLSTLSLCEITTPGIALTPSPCHVDSDPLYNGIRVNCKHKGISSLPLPPHWLPPNITSLLLDHNAITELNIDSFASSIFDITSLRSLGLSCNKISSIGPNAFSQFVSLQRLDLNRNLLNLDLKLLDGQVFQGLSNLTELHLVDNANDQITGAYNESLFSELVALETVSLDTFTGNLYFGSLFLNTRKLLTLELTGGVSSITNRSFEGFVYNQLTKLKITFAKALWNIETGAFQYLHHLTWFQISDSSPGINNTLNSLAPFVNRNMSHLIFHSLYRSYTESRDFAYNSVITRHMARYLSAICVQNFVLEHSYISIIESKVIINPVWKSCLKSLVIKNNPLNGELPVILEFGALSQLEYIEVSGKKYVYFGPGPHLWKLPACIAKNEPSHTQSFLSYSYGKKAETSHPLSYPYGTSAKVSHTLSYPYGATTGPSHTESLLSYPYDKPAKNKMKKVSEKLLPHNVNRKAGMSSWSRYGNLALVSPIPTSIESSFTFENGMYNKRKHSIGVDGGPTILFPISPTLRGIILNSNGYSFGKLKSIKFIGGGNLQEFHIADNGMQNFAVNFYGLKTLKVLDISRNDGSIMSPTFFDSLSTIVHLNMADMKLDVNFMTDNSERLFHKLSNLSTLDLSDNGLLHLTKNTFATNTQLCVLSLRGNRFESIPVDMINVPNLSHLDMRDNSLKLVSNTEMASLDNHFKQTGLFSLSLQGNAFDCGCESLRFLSWLQRTKISLDNNRNYTCFLVSGQRTTTGKIDDLNMIWRKCHGENAFWITLTLACFMMLGYLCCFMMPKIKTQLKTIILKTFWIPFVMKTPLDYPIGVYIGYADQDTTLVCRSLRLFIEEKLNLSTYIRHRDLLPASDMAESIMEAIHSSWRVLLVVSQHFLEDPWSYYVLKASTYAVQSDNPGRIVLVLIDADDQVMSKLPDYVLRAVREESIITMTSTGRISYEDKQAFKTALLYRP